MHQYSIHIYWNEDENSFVADVPELVGCTGTGATHEEALSAVHPEIEAWIDSAREAGHPIPAPQEQQHQQNKKSRGGRRQERIEQRRRKREQGRHERRRSS